MPGLVRALQRLRQAARILKAKNLEECGWRCIRISVRLRKVFSMSPHLKSVLQALLVTFLWSTSVILVKVGLETLPALTFAGLRYGLAFCFLLPLAWHVSRRHDGPALSPANWRKLIALGLVMYTLTQGAQFLALQYLPAATHSMMLNGTNIIVLVMGVIWLSEVPTRLQVVGLVLFVIGVVLYFFPADFSGAQLIGLTIAGFQVFSNAGAATLGRFVNRTATIPAVVITTVSMGIGALVLVVGGLLTQGLPPLDLPSIAIIVWLAAINTAFAFTLWNYTQRTLSAMESSMINSTMLIQIGVLAWVFLGEALTSQEIIGMVAAAIGILLVQLRRVQFTSR